MPCRDGVVVVWCGVAVAVGLVAWLWLVGAVVLRLSRDSFATRR